MKAGGERQRPSWEAVDSQLPEKLESEKRGIGEKRSEWTKKRGIDSEEEEGCQCARMSSFWECTDMPGVKF